MNATAEIEQNEADIPIHEHYKLELATAKAEAMARGEEWKTTFTRGGIEHKTKWANARYKGLTSKIRGCHARIAQQTALSAQYQSFVETLNGTSVRDSIVAWDMQHAGTVTVLARSLGSKMAWMLRDVQAILAHDLRHRIILFSRFGNVLTTIKQHLAEIGIASATMGGQVHVRNKALRAFGRTDKPFADETDLRVLLLSLNQTASGSDLTRVSHVILVDPICGTKEEARAAEHQVITMPPHHRQITGRQTSTPEDLCIVSCM
jgi:hypothetical protein